MAAAIPPEHTSKEFSLSELESITLSLTKLWLMVQDRKQADSQTVRYLQGLVFADYSTTIGARLAVTDDSVFEAIGDSYRDRIRGAVQLNEPDRWAALLRSSKVVEALWDTITETDRALLLGLELVAFSPWGDPRVLEGDSDGGRSVSAS